MFYLMVETERQYPLWAPFDYLEPIEPKISIEIKFLKYFNKSVESIDFFDIFLTQGAGLIHSHKTNSDPF